MPIKSVKMKKMRFFLISQGSLNPKIRFLAQKLWSVARVQTHTDRQTRKWLLWAPFQGFRSFPFNLSSRIGPTLLFLKDRIQTFDYSTGPIRSSDTICITSMRGNKIFFHFVCALRGYDVTSDVTKPFSYISYSVLY